ncbi:MAG: TrmJ/YjtD family RNA methyltransferase [Gemmatimonadaceae bacterium]|nr:TrmJ/YjtD family RNA methyltransferase [Gemmatimonadaceae bacterium]
MNESRLALVRVVLLEPQDPINIGATVRAMKNMGVSSLRLVRPVAYDPYRLAGVAHDAAEIIGAIEHFDSLEVALSDCVRVAGFTARRRAAKREVLEPSRAAADLLEYAVDGPVALLFGREDKGLPNEALDLAHTVVTVPTTGHASLNLAQAVLIALYELHIAAADATRKLAPPRKAADAPTSAQYDLLFADAKRALTEIAFFRTRNSEHVMRSLRSIVFRAAPDGRELDLLRAMAIEVVRSLDRAARDSSRDGKGESVR